MLIIDLVLKSATQQKFNIITTDGNKIQDFKNSDCKIRRGTEQRHKTKAVPELEQLVENLLTLQFISVIRNPSPCLYVQ
jgi:hypothetical protein